LTEQGRKLMKTLTVVVNGLGNLQTILPAASALAKGHVAYGVKPAHYTPVGEALLWILERGLGPDWTAELEGAWSAAYTTLANFMIAEAYGRQAAAE
jgi:hemoglobin-like flavoprotein